MHHLGNILLARRVRDIMKIKGENKTPGFSSVDIYGVVSEFIAGEKTHLGMEGM